MKFILLLVFLLKISASTITTINIIGNEHTLDQIILREIQQPIPGPFNDTVAKEDRNRIYNLGIFSLVEIIEKDSIYTITVVESPRIIPVPLMDYDEALGWSYGAGILNMNYRGVNESLQGGVMLGERPTYFFNFYDPWLWGNHGSLSINLLNQYSDHHVYPLQRKIWGVYTHVGIQNAMNHRFKVGIGYNTFSSVKIDRQEYESFRIKNKWVSTDEYFFNRFEYRFDNRDVYIDPTKGKTIEFELVNNWHPEKESSYHQIFIGSEYHYSLVNSFLKPVLSFSISSAIQFSNDLPYHAYLYLGGEEYVRGYSPNPIENGIYENQIEVENVIYNSTQLQFTIVPRENHNGIETGIDGLIFVDHGLGWSIGDMPQLSSSIYGTGIGFRFFMSGLGYLGLDVGVNPSGNMQVHLSSAN